MTAGPGAPTGCAPCDLVFSVAQLLQGWGLSPRVTRDSLANAERSAAQLLTDLGVPVERPRVIASSGEPS